jgi:catalase
VKFHLVCQQGIKNLTDAEAEAIIAKDRESHQRDLYESIERGEFPRWKMRIQAMPEADAAKCPYHPFDLTKVWFRKDYPLIDVGIMELNRNPENYFAEVEQSAFNPANVVPGIGFSPDKMLQERLFAYTDAQRYRLGVNFNHIPTNAPQCPVHAYHRDGQMRTDGNLGATPSYFPNSHAEWIDQHELNEPAMNWSGPDGHFDHTAESDYFEQPGNLFRKMDAAQRQLLFDNTARALRGVSRQIQQRHIDNCRQADAAYGDGVREALQRLDAGSP